MDNTLNKIHSFGKVTHILITIFFVIACIITLFTTIVGLYLIQCKDISIVADNDISIKIKEDGKILNFDFDGNLDGLVIDIGNINLKDFKVVKENGDTVIVCKTNNKEFTLKDFGLLTMFAGLQCIVECMSLFILKKICKYIRDCESFFTDELVNYMYKYMYSLIPMFILSLFVYYYKNQLSILSVDLDYGFLVEIGIIYIITTIFKYGVKLQTESDETL